MFKRFRRRRFRPQIYRGDSKQQQLKQIEEIQKMGQYFIDRKLDHYYKSQSMKEWNRGIKYALKKFKSDEWDYDYMLFGAIENLEVNCRIGVPDGADNYARLEPLLDEYREYLRYVEEYKEKIFAELSSGINEMHEFKSKSSARKFSEKHNGRIYTAQIPVQDYFGNYIRNKTYYYVVL